MRQEIKKLDSKFEMNEDQLLIHQMQPLVARSATLSTDLARFHAAMCYAAHRNLELCPGRSCLYSSRASKYLPGGTSALRDMASVLLEVPATTRTLSACCK